MIYIYGSNTGSREGGRVFQKFWNLLWSFTLPNPTLVFLLLPQISFGNLLGMGWEPGPDGYANERTFADVMFREKFETWEFNERWKPFSMPSSMTKVFDPWPLAMQVQWKNECAVKPSGFPVSFSFHVVMSFLAFRVFDHDPKRNDETSDDAWTSLGFWFLFCKNFKKRSLTA